MKLPQLICLITLGAALSTGAWSAAAQSTPTPTATPATPQAEAGVLLDSLYPGGVPADAQPKPRAAAASASTTLTRTADASTSGSTGTATLSPAGTLLVRRARRPAVRLGGTTPTKTLALATTTTTTMTTTSTSTTTRTLRRLTPTTGTLTSNTLASNRSSSPSVHLDANDALTTQSRALRSTANSSGTLNTTSSAAVVLPPPGSPPNPEGVWINRATPAELQHKLKLDARRARLLVEFRKTFGPFKTPEDLTQVSGITGDMVKIWESNELLFFD